jgi:hypothetical protein
MESSEGFLIFCLVILVAWLGTYTGARLAGKGHELSFRRAIRDIFLLKWPNRRKSV